MPAINIVFIIGVLSCSALAQDKPIYLEITLNRPYVINGRFVSETDSTLVILNEYDILVTIKKNQIINQQNIADSVAVRMEQKATMQAELDNRAAFATDYYRAPSKIQIGNNFKIGRNSWSAGFGFGIGQGYNLHATWHFPIHLSSLPEIRPAITLGYLALRMRQPDNNWANLSQSYREVPESTTYQTTEPGKFAVLELQSHFIWKDYDWVIRSGYGVYYPYWYTFAKPTQLLTFGLMLKRDNFYGEWLYFRPESPELFRGNQVSLGFAYSNPGLLFQTALALMTLEYIYGAYTGHTR